MNGGIVTSSDQQDTMLRVMAWSVGFHVARERLWNDEFSKRGDRIRASSTLVFLKVALKGMSQRCRKMIGKEIKRGLQQANGVYQ